MPPTTRLGLNDPINETMSRAGSPTSSSPASGPGPGSAGEQIREIRETIREEYFGGARLLASDARVVYLLVDEARSRVIASMFGISGENSALVTAIALGIGAQAVRAKFVQVLAAPGPPTSADAVIGTAVLREGVHRITGISTREAPLLGGLVTVALASAVLRPALGTAVRGARASSQRARAGFDHRYGHVIRRTWARSVA